MRGEQVTDLSTIIIQTSRGEGVPGRRLLQQGYILSNMLYCPEIFEEEKDGVTGEEWAKGSNTR